MDTQAVNGMPRRNRLAARSSSVTLAAGTAAALAAIYLGNRLGWWWITFAVGCGVGLLLGRGRALAACGLLALLAWGGDLALQATQGGVGRIAQVTGGLMGLGNHAGALVVALTLLYGVALCAGGGWLGLSLASLRHARRAQARLTQPALDLRPAATLAAMPSVITVRDARPALRVGSGNGAPSLPSSNGSGVAPIVEISPGHKEELPNAR